MSDLTPNGLADLARSVAAPDDILEAIEKLPVSDMEDGDVIRVNIGSAHFDMPLTEEFIDRLRAGHEARGRLERARAAKRQAQLDYDEAGSRLAALAIPRVCATAGVLVVAIALDTMGFATAAIVAATLAGLAAAGVFTIGAAEADHE